MSESYSPSGTYPTFPLTLPLDGELITHAILINGVAKPTIDAADYTNSRVTAIHGAKGATITRFAECPQIPTSGTWAATANGYYSTSVATVCNLVIPLPESVLPHGVTLAAIALQISPNGGHASLFGLTLPTLSLYSTTAGVSNTLIGATTSDPSASAGAYNAFHSISITVPPSTVIDRTTKRYFLALATEFGGANAAAGLTAIGPILSYTAL